MKALTTINPRPDAALKYAVDSAVVVTRGDMCWLNTDDIRDADAFTWDTDEPTTRRKFCALFAGIATESSPSGKTDDILVMGPGAIVEDYPCTSSTFEIGDMVGPEKDAAGNTLDNDLVQAVTDPREAIGLVVKAESSAVTAVTFQLLPAVMLQSLGSLKVRDFFFPVPTDLTNDNAACVTDWLFPNRCKLLELIGITGTVVAADTTAPKVAYKNGDNEGDDTLEIADGSAVGAVTSQAIADANGYDIFDVDDKLDIYTETPAADSSSAAGAAYIVARVMEY